MSLFLRLIGKDPDGFATYIVITEGPWILRARYISRGEMHRRTLSEVASRWLTRTAESSEMAMIKNLVDRDIKSETILKWELGEAVPVVITEGYTVDLGYPIDGYVTGTVTGGPDGVRGKTFLGDSVDQVHERINEAIKEAVPNEPSNPCGRPIGGWEDYLGPVVSRSGGI